MVAVLGDGSFHQQVDAAGILLAVDGVQVAGCAHYKLPRAVLQYHVVDKCGHILIDIAHVVGDVFIGQQTVGVIVQYFFSFSIHIIYMWFTLQTAKIMLFSFTPPIFPEKRADPIIIAANDSMVSV